MGDDSNLVSPGSDRQESFGNDQAKISQRSARIYLHAKPVEHDGADGYPPWKQEGEATPRNEQDYFNDYMNAKYPEDIDSPRRGIYSKVRGRRRKASKFTNIRKEDI